MSKPLVAIVGRPNVGKSTLFNKLAGKKISIVEDSPGVTRDRIYVDVEWLNYKFTLVDTGGLEPDSKDTILKQMYIQAEIAIETADVIIFIVDSKVGVLDADMKVANILRKTKKPVMLVVNKVDNMRRPSDDTYEFYSLGLGDPIAISAGQALGLGDMLDNLIKYFPKIDSYKDEEEIIKVAIIGKPNVGKSSLINKILREDRVIVSNISGTTRDAIDAYYEKNGQKYIFIDTAGMRRKNKIKENIEYYSILRAVSAIERCDVCILIISAEDGITDQDTKIAGIAHEKGKAVIVCVNKWDLIEKNDKTMKKYIKDIETELAYMAYAPKIFISVLIGQRVTKLFEYINNAYRSAVLRISTGLLNDVLIEAMAMNQPAAEKGKQLKIYYITQVSIKPPTFILFVNDVKLLHFSYKRYIENQIRQAFGFNGTPIHFIIRKKSERN